MKSTTKKNARDDNDSDSDDDSLFESSSSSSVTSPQPDKKRRKLNKNDSSNDETQNNGNGEKKNDGHDTQSATKTNGTSSAVDPVLLEHAKSRLSKFAARLFDPNRIRGLVEGPLVIPLNDEFLKAFGKREKEMDQLRGREETFDHEIADDDDDDENDGGKKKKRTSDKSKTSKNKETSNNKIKINNLAFRTTEDTLTKACLRFGDVVEVNMVLEGPVKANSNNHNSGRAYATFETDEGAQSCLEGLKSLDGRPLRISLAAARPLKNNSGKGRTSASLLNNQSAKDISTVCFRCGQVGHFESNCPNPAKMKPCCLCGMTDHDFRGCPTKQVCFNCGQPGHVNRECKMRRGLPRRMVCGTCFQSGHHRLQCQMRSLYDVPAHVTSSAVCMDCGKKGHFLCKELKWFYGLRGMSCFNCGSQGHSGYECDRPSLYQCLNNPDGTQQEIDRAEANSISEELERERREQREREQEGSRDRGRSNNRKSDGGKKRRAKSSGPTRRDQRGYR